MAVKPGDILGKKYRVDALIGRGGMGQVFAATDLEGPAPPVAIKVVSRMMFDETLMARLHREAEAASRIRSEYVPRVLEVSDTEDREMFLVMERLVGEPLSQRMRDKGALPWSEVVRIGEDVLRGVIDAHIAGVVHRDLKPSNVFLALKGGRIRAMVLDFGVCKMDTVDTERLTATGESIGTVAYMAPEQIRGASKVDDRADLYAFGVLVFEMLSGRLPHDGPSQMAILASKLEKEAARLRNCSLVPTPEGLDALVAKALARDPAQRFTSAQELLKAWRKLGPADVPASTPSLTNGDGEPSAHDLDNAPTTRTAPEDGTSPPERGRNQDDVTAHGDSAVGPPVDVHFTQTALTQGVSLRKGGGGRIAFVAAACALVAGVISVVAFFARGPETPAVAAGPAASTTASTTLTAPATPPPAVLASAEAPPDPGPASTSIDLDSEPVSEPANAAAGKVDPRKVAPRKPIVKGATPGAPGAKSSAPHITSQPRY